jgi:diguanylate cyclase (GGDEF)-like protein
MNHLVENFQRQGKKLLAAWVPRSLPGLIAALLTIGLLKLGVWQPLEFIAYDNLLRWRGEGSWDERTVVIQIDSASVRKLGAFPAVRHYYAQLLDVLAQAKPNVVVFDILFSEVAPEDAQLVSAMQRHGHVVLAQAWDENDTPLLPTRELEQAAIATGHILSHRDSDALTRIVIPTILDIPALSLAAVRTYFLMGNQPPLPEINHPLWINWQKSQKNIPHYSLVDVLENQVPVEIFKNKVVLVGVSAVGMDVVETPFDLNPPSHGVFLHATLVSNLFQNNFLRPLNHQTWMMILLVLGGLLVSSLFTYQSGTKQLLIYVVISGSWILLSFFMFMANYWLPTATPIGLFSITAFLLALQELRTLEVRNQQLLYLATHDELTKIANRRQFNEELEVEWRRLAREARPLALIVCDIDFFTFYNQTYGRAMGDSCLQQIAIAIAKAVKRSADLVARYTGEEFAVILPNTNIEGAIQVVEEIRTRIEALNIPHRTSQVSSRVTLSFGVACITPNSNLPPAILIEAANRSLNQAKEEGHDRYLVCSL